MRGDRRKEISGMIEIDGTAAGIGRREILRKLKNQWNQRVERPRIMNRRITGQRSEPSGSVTTFRSDLERLKERGIRNNLARRCAITLRWHRIESRRNCDVIRLPSSNFGGSDNSVNQDPRRLKSTSLKVRNWFLRQSWLLASVNETCPQSGLRTHVRLRRQRPPGHESLTGPFETNPLYRDTLDFLVFF